MIKCLNTIIAICTLATTLSPVNVAASTYDECILNGMKSVSSDAASRMIARACANKRDEKHNDFIKVEYGNVVAVGENIYKVSKEFGQYSDGRKYVNLTNLSQSHLITYVALTLKDQDFYDYEKIHSAEVYSRNMKVRMDSFFKKQEWEAERTRHLYYKLKLPPSRTVALIVPAKGATFFVEQGEVRAREKRWSDIGNYLAEKASPEDKDPLTM